MNWFIGCAGILGGLALVAWGLFFDLVHRRIAERRTRRKLQDQAIGWIAGQGSSSRRQGNDRMKHGLSDKRRYKTIEARRQL